MATRRRMARAERRWRWRVPCPTQASLEAARGTLLITTYVRCGPSSFVPPLSLGSMLTLVDQPERLAPLPAGAEPLEQDGDDADSERRAIQACLHLVTSLSFLPRFGGPDLTAHRRGGAPLL